MQTGEINLYLEDVPYPELERYRRVLAAIVASGALGIRSGNVTLHFRDGELKQVDKMVRMTFKEQSDDTKERDDQRRDVLEP